METDIFLKIERSKAINRAVAELKNALETFHSDDQNVYRTLSRLTAELEELKEIYI